MAIFLIFGGITSLLIFLVIIILLMHENSVRTKVEKELRSRKEHLNDLVEERTSELKASGQRWAAILASLADGVIATDEIGRVAFMNAAAESITGWSLKEALNKPLHEVFKIMSEGRREPLKDPFERVLKEGVISDLADHSLLVQKDGKEIPIDNSGSRMQKEDGTVMGVVIVFHDRTKHRQAEEALRYQAALLNFAHDAIIVRDAENKITFWNRGAEETYGWAQVEVVGRVTHDLLKTRFPKPLEEIYEEAGQTGEWNGELSHIRKDGQEIVVASRWALQRDIWGRHVATLEINRNVTDLKKLEEARAQLAAIVEHADVAIYSKTLDGIILSWNQGAQKLYGYTSDEVVGKPVSILMPSGHEDEMPETLQKVREGEAVRDFEAVRMRKDGTLVTVSLTVSPVKDLSGTVTGASTIAHDITERKQAEEALRESQQRFYMMANAIPQLAWIAQADGYIYWYNRRWYEYTGTTPEQMEGWGWQSVHDPDMLQKVLERWKQSIATGEPFDMEFPLRGADGTFHQFLTRVMPIKNAEGHIIQWFGTNTDVTKLKQAEEALQHRTEELTAANRDLESFSYSVSHDLRNPLNTINGFVGFLMEDYSERLDEEGRNYLCHIGNGVDKMKALIDDMLNLSRIGRQEMSRTDVDLSAIVRNYLQELKSTEPERRADFIIQDEVHVNADPRLIHLALENLLRNAWKFTSKKDVARIEFGTAVKDGQIVYFIRDNGVGFDMQFAAKIFEPFKRVHAEREFGGTGVGLSIVQRVIGRHGGKIWAESEPDKGATFFFTLPV
jgi:PAS domain S-box-containing protein